MVLLDLPLWAVLTWLFMLGSVLGSFLNVCIYRIPQEESFGNQLRGLIWPSSRCPKCGQPLLRRDNVPIFGWLWLRGRCRFCRTRISARYPLVELLNALLFVAVYLMEVPWEPGSTIRDSCLFTDLWQQTIGWDGSSSLPRAEQMWLLHWRYAFHMVLIEALLVATFIDFDLWIIPDGATLPAMAVGLLGAVAHGMLWLVPIWCVTPSAPPGWIVASPHMHGLAVSLAGLVMGGGIVWTVRIIGTKILKREAMGFGDVVLMAMIGSFVGWQPVVVVFFLAPMCALVWVAVRWMFQPNREFPYGPYLSLATLVVLIGWNQIWPRVERIFCIGPLLVPMAAFGIGMLALSLLLVQLVKRLLGISLDEEPWQEVWTSADQLTHFSREKIDLDQGSWRAAGRCPDEWAGKATGRGMRYEQRWRSDC